MAAAVGTGAPEADESFQNTWTNITSGFFEEILPEITSWPVRERFLVSSPLSAFWSVRAVKEQPKRVFQLFNVYLMGMFAYAFELPIRIGMLVYRIFSIIGVLNSSDRSWKGVGDWAIGVVGGVGHVLSGVVGVVAPPVAYWLDEKLVNSHPVIESNLGYYGWRYISTDAAFRESFDAPVASGEGGVHASHAQYFRDAAATLKRYCHKDIGLMMGNDMRQLLVLGLLMRFKEVSSEDFFEPLTFATSQKWTPPEDFMSTWGTHLQDTQVLEWLTNKAILDYSDNAKDFQPGKKTELSGLLAGRDHNELYMAIRTAVVHFSGDHEEQGGQRQAATRIAQVAFSDES